MSADTIPPLDGLRGIEHVGLTVPDMDQALEFFQSVIGAQVLYELGPLQASDNWMAVNLGVDADAVIQRLVMIRIATGPCVELLEFAADASGHLPPPPNEVGSQHLAFYVNDIDASVERLRHHGLIVLGEAKKVMEGPNAGLAWAHFLAPWGQQFEVVSYPQGVAAYADQMPAVWTPGDALDEEDVDN